MPKPRERFLSASHTGPDSSLAFVNDGNTAWYHRRPPLRWTSEGSRTESDWVTVDFGAPRPLTEVKLYLLDDGEGQPISAPAAVALEYTAGGDDAWKPVPGTMSACYVIVGASMALGRWMTGPGHDAEWPQGAHPRSWVWEDVPPSDLERCCWRCRSPT